MPLPRKALSPTSELTIMPVTQGKHTVGLLTVVYQGTIWG